VPPALLGAGNGPGATVAPDVVEAPFIHLEGRIPAPRGRLHGQRRITTK
jgi:hypothetical protein